jgi:signal transduction histidine kinase/CheY-like chemotaxis protein
MFSLDEPAPVNSKDVQAVAAAADVDLDPRRPAHRHIERLRRLNTREIPGLRVLGFALLCASLYLYNLQMGDPAGNVRLPTFVFAVTFYCAFSWLVLDRLFVRLKPALDLGLLFLAADLVFFGWAVYLSGGDHSWFLLLLVFRTADQLTSGFRRALFFAHASTLTYVALLLYLVYGEGRDVTWPTELLKTLLLYGGNLYLAFSARSSDQRRRRSNVAIRVAQGLIRDLEQQSAELEEARRRAEVASQAKSQFLANMSHELRTPMNAITGLAEILSWSSLNENQQRRLELLHASAGELLSVIDDVLDFSRVEAAQLTLEPVDCDVRNVVGEVVRRLAQRAEAKDLELRLEVDPEQPERCRLDPVRVRQVLMHLVGNAIKFTDQGGVVVRVQPVADDGGDRLYVEVEDSGPGFAPALVDDLFEPFTQGDGSLTRRHGGTGLGLTICRRLVQLMDGEIGGRNAPGGGSIFWLSLPAPVVDSTTSLRQASTVETTRARVLVVEDNPINQLVAVELLQCLGIETEQAGDGAEALERMESRRFDLVLMDCQMPVMDGYRATAEIRRLEGDVRHTPIVAVTAHAMEGDRERCLAAGMDDYLPKPLDLETLADALGRWIDLTPSAEAAAL